MPLQIRHTQLEVLLRVVREVLTGEGGRGEAGRACLDSVGNMFPKSQDGNDFQMS